MKFLTSAFRDAFSSSVETKQTFAPFRALGLNL